MPSIQEVTVRELAESEMFEIQGGGCNLAELRSETIRGAIRGAISGLVTGTVKGMVVGAIVGGMVEAGDYTFTCSKDK